MNLASFYDSSKWTLPFWAWGSRYTIVPNRHIGLDIGRFGGKTETVPALVSGTVVRVRWTSSMGVCVVVHAEDGRYYAYCHLANDRPLPEGARVAAGGRVGRLAIGARNPSDVDFPGTAWDGIHLHLVVSNHPDAAYTFPRIRGSEFYDPAPIIRSVLSRPAGGGERPFNPPRPQLVKKDDHSMRTIRWNEKHVFTLGEQQIAHLDNVKYAINAAIIHNPDGKYIELDDDGLTTALITFGIPWSAVDACMRNLAYDISGAVGGRFWARAIEQKIDTSRMANSLEDLKRTVESGA